MLVVLRVVLVVLRVAVEMAAVVVVVAWASVAPNLQTS